MTPKFSNRPRAAGLGPRRRRIRLGAAGSGSRDSALSLALDLDVHVRRAVKEGLRLRGVDVLSAQEDAAAEMEDPALLNRAMGLGRVVFTQDEDFLREAHRRLGSGEPFWRGHRWTPDERDDRAVRGRPGADREGL